MEQAKRRGAPKKPQDQKKKTVTIGIKTATLNAFGGEKAFKAAAEAWAESYVIHNVEPKP